MNVCQFPTSGGPSAATLMDPTPRDHSHPSRHTCCAVARMKFLLGPRPAHLHWDWDIVCALHPLPGDATWQSAEVYFAAGSYGRWSIDWHTLGATLVAYVTHGQVRSLLCQQLARKGLTLEQALAVTPGGLAQLCP